MNDNHYRHTRAEVRTFTCRGSAHFFNGFKFELQSDAFISLSCPETFSVFNPRLLKKKGHVI